MNENEKMELVEVENNEEPEVVEERSGMSTGLAMLIGAGLALAGAKVAKFAKKKYDEVKAKKESSATVGEVNELHPEDVQVEEPEK